MKIQLRRAIINALVAAGVFVGGAVLQQQEATADIELYFENFEGITTDASVVLNGTGGFVVENYYSSNGPETIKVRTIADLNSAVTSARSGDYVVSGFDNDGTGANSPSGQDSSSWWWQDGGIGANYEEGETYRFSWYVNANQAGEFGSNWIWAENFGWTEFTNSNSISDWTEVSFEYTATALDDGQAIDFRIYNYANSAIDDVRVVQVEAIPEPSSFAALAVATGLLGGIGVYRRKRSALKKSDDA